MKTRDFAIVSEKTSGNIEIAENTQYNNIDADNVFIHENVTARLFGKIKSVSIKKGACLYMHGPISGKIEHCEGELHVFCN